MNPADRRVVKRRYCPACQHYTILPDAEVCCHCGAPASRRFPTLVNIGADHPDAGLPGEVTV